jgi:hypothetical protein
MAQERKTYLSMEDMTPPKVAPDSELHKSIEFQLIKTSASYFDLDLPEKYKKALVSDRKVNSRNLVNHEKLSD